MTNDLTKTIEELYEKVREFPKTYPDKFVLITDGSREISKDNKLHYCSFIQYNEPKKLNGGKIQDYIPELGIKGREELWREYFTPLWYGLEKIAKENGVSCHFSNRIIHSKFNVDTDIVSLSVYSPKGRFIGLRPKVKARMRKKKNYSQELASKILH